VIIGITCNRKEHEIDTLQSVNHTYLRAVEAHMQAQPLLIPASTDGGKAINAELILDRIDGLLVTGNRSNIHPSLYETHETDAHGPFDTQRDDMSFALIRGALARNMPILAICRGLQELNVVCGGTLVNEVHTIDGRLSHKTPKITPGSDNQAAAEQIYAARHDIVLSEGGYLAGLLGTGTARVNSLHRQAIDQLGDGLRVDAVAEDGTIEAVCHSASDYCIGVQWHPEMQPDENIISQPLFADFDRAIAASMGQ
jgi:putative glutamine amidotransferase